MSDGINGSLSERAEARREATEREAAHAKGQHAPGCHPAWGMCECGLAERLSAENADLRARLEAAERERDEALALLNEKDAALQAARENPNDFARSVERGGHIVTELCLRKVLKERDEARTDLDRFKKNWFSARSELEVSERAQEQLRADLERDRMKQHEQGDDLTTVYMVGREAGKDMVKADLERVQVEVRRLRQVERLALAYRDVFSERLQHVADNPLAPNGSSKWLQQAKDLLASEISALKSLFAALGEEEAE